MAEWTDIQPDEISFQEKLFESKNNLLYFVSLRGVTCVMKVYDNKEYKGTFIRNGEEYKPVFTDYERNRFIREANSYRRLQEHGLCDRGIVPKLYGTLHNFDPKHPSYLPYLRRFVNKEELPSAIFIEYIPDLEKFTLEKYSEPIFDKFMEAMREIHKAFVLHGDIYPRNMFLIKNDPNRVLWLDFDRARVYNEDKILDSELRLLDREERLLMDFKKMIEQDIAAGTTCETQIMF